MYKAVLHNDLLQDPDEGVNYFKNTLKKFCLKGSTNVLVQTSQFLQSPEAEHRVPHIYIKIILLMKLKAAWMDLMPAHTAQSPEFIASANARRIAAHQQAAGTRASRSAADRQSRSTQAAPYRHADKAPRSKVNCQISKEKG